MPARNDSKVDRPDVEIRCMSAAAKSCVPARSSRSVRVAVPVPRRGVTRIAQFELRNARHPFGWFHAWTYVQGSLIAYVAPSPKGTRTLPAVSGAGYASASEARGDEDFAGLRAYQSGMPLKHMAWKVLARGADAAVQSFTSLAAQPEWLEWSSLEGQDPETRLSQLCLWVLESDAAQRVFGLRIPGREIPPARGAAHRFACLRALAVYGMAEPR